MTSHTIDRSVTIPKNRDSNIYIYIYPTIILTLALSKACAWWLQAQHSQLPQDQNTVHRCTCDQSKSPGRENQQSAPR